MRPLDKLAVADLEENLNEIVIPSIIIKGIIGLLTVLGAAGRTALGRMIIERIIEGAVATYHDIKNIVAPAPYIKFLKSLEKNDNFNKEFIQFMLKGKDESEKLSIPIIWKNEITSLPSFIEAFNKFTTEQNIGEEDKDRMLSVIKNSMWNSYENKSKEIHQYLKKRYPEMSGDIEEELHEGEYCPQCLIEYIKSHKNILTEAEYKGRKVPLGKPMKGDVKKFKVYIKNKKGNVIKVEFGQPGVKIKKNNPARRKSFRARHRCHTAKDRTTARYWSCRKW